MRSFLELRGGPESRQLPWKCLWSFGKWSEHGGGSTSIIWRSHVLFVQCWFREFRFLRLAHIAEALHLDPPNKETCVGVDRPTCGDVITVELHRPDDGRSTDSTHTGVLCRVYIR